LLAAGHRGLQLRYVGEAPVIKAIRDMDKLAHIHFGELFRMAGSGYFCSVRYHHGPAKRGILLRQKLFTYAICVVASAFTDAQVGDGAGIRFGFENETGFSIEAVYVVPVARKDWGPDLLNDRNSICGRPGSGIVRCEGSLSW
jgi:hypothetical protein